MDPPTALESPTTPTQLQPFPSLSISESEESTAALRTTHDPLETLSSSLPAGDSDEDEQSGSDDDDGYDRVLPQRTATLPPQLGALELPSPVFGRSFVDLLDFAPSSTTSASTGIIPGPRPARQRTPSILGSLRSSVYASASASGQHLREPTLTFSRPRTMKDERKRREGKEEEEEEEVWVGVFPGPEEECELGEGVEVGDWGVEEWEEVRAFVRERGYAIDEQSSWPTLLAQRISDSLPLSVLILPTDSPTSYELDILEHLSSAGLRSNARAQKIVPCVPLVGIVPMNEEWTAVMVERWRVLDASRFEPAELQGLLVDISGAITFLHSQHISQLAVSPRTIVRSPSLSSSHSTSPRHHYSLTAFYQSHQGDSVAATKGKKILIPSEGIESPAEGWRAPELGAGGTVDPKAIDLWGLGRLMEYLAELSRVRNAQLGRLICDLTQEDPNARPSAADVLMQVRTLQLG